MHYSRTIYRGLGLSQKWYWIGLNDKVREGKYRWVNGNQADDFVWWSGQPDNIPGAADCAVAMFSNVQPYGFRAWDYPCSNRYAIICEKLV